MNFDDSMLKESRESVDVAITLVKDLFDTQCGVDPGPEEVAWECGAKAFLVSLTICDPTIFNNSGHLGN